MITFICGAIDCLYQQSVHFLKFNLFTGIGMIILSLMNVDM